MDSREIASYTKSFLDSSAFLYMFKRAFRPLVRRWAHQLLHDEKLDPAERKGIVMAMQELHNGFVEMYEHCDLEVPEWLGEEFFRGLISE